MNKFVTVVRENRQYQILFPVQNYEVSMIAYIQVSIY